jgi:flagellar hook-associated protein 1 FlgK
MSLTGALNAAVSSLRVNQAAIQLVSANVAHANDPGYVRKTISREALGLGDDQLGGVAVGSYQNAVSISLRKQFEALTAQTGTTDAQMEYLSRIQDLFGTSADKAQLTALLSDFTAAWQAFQANPESAAAQSQVVSLGDRFAQEINRLADGVDSIDNDVRTDLGNSVTQLNDLLEKMFQLNLQLRSSSDGGAERAQLEDQRDQLVREISKYVDVKTVDRENGSIALFTSAGLSLVDGPPSKFSYDGVNVTRVEDPTTPINTLMRDGKIRALLDLRLDNSGSNQPISNDPATEVIRKLRSQLDMAVSAFTATTGNPPTFGAAYDNSTSSLRISASFQNTVEAKPSTAQFTTVSLSGDLQAGDVFEVEVNGKKFSYTAQVGDTSLDQIAAQLSALVNADGTLGVTAVAGISALQLVGSNINQKFTVKTTVNGQLPELNQAFFTGTDRYTFKVNQSLLDGTQQLKKNSASSTVTALTAADRNFVSAGLVLTNVSYKGMAVGLVGASLVNAKTIQDAGKFHTDSLTLTEQRYQSDVGVNLDEEIANLQVLQNSYAASARLLTVVQDLFDQLQQAVSR